MKTLLTQAGRDGRTGNEAGPKLQPRSRHSSDHIKDMSIPLRQIEHFSMAALHKGPNLPIPSRRKTGEIIWSPTP